MLRCKLCNEASCTLYYEQDRLLNTIAVRNIFVLNHIAAHEVPLHGPVTVR